ncbi:TPA: LOW QUALITY PROTEIN: hypothetical protein N0F65_012760 [Lagenidium giganteum]|uniref:Uncharacterized protein n=1 Tax=Lagenidium giganteum TaxID=4803 RepID=A0AAV2YEA9_9STRA|nr:TPA: LOW QUALITY PROTEIN: hypothetical protein N0F65_012760 [Lagenidium giganteum]
MHTNSNWHMKRVLAHFVGVNDCVHKPKIVTVDNVLNEIKVVERFLPQVKVLICLFQVLISLGKEIKDPKYGKLSSEDQDALIDLVHAMVGMRWSTLHECVQRRNTLKNTKIRQILRVFDENWDNSPYSWAKHMHQYLSHFKGDTNNALESFIG